MTVTTLTLYRVKMFNGSVWTYDKSEFWFVPFPDATRRKAELRKDGWTGKIEIECAVMSIHTLGRIDT